MVCKIRKLCTVHKHCSFLPLFLNIYHFHCRDYVILLLPDFILSLAGDITTASLFLHSLSTLSAPLTTQEHFVVLQLQTAVHLFLWTLLSPLSWSGPPQAHHRAGIIWVVAHFQLGMWIRHNSAARMFKHCVHSIRHSYLAGPPCRCKVARP